MEIMVQSKQAADIPSSCIWLRFFQNILYRVDSNRKKGCWVRENNRQRSRGMKVSVEKGTEETWGERVGNCAKDKG